MANSCPHPIDRFPYDMHRSDRVFLSTLSPALGNTILIKRSIAPDEYPDSAGRDYWDSLKMKESLRNEVAAIRFVKQHTTVPVPNVVGAFVDRGVYYMMIEKEQNVIGLQDLAPGQREEAVAEINGYVAQLQSLRSTRFGGVEGDTIIPAPLTASNPVAFAHLDFPLESQSEYVLCHGDLHAGNILLDAETHKVRCIVDWEYAGFYPAEMEQKWFLRDGGPFAFSEEEGQREEMIDVVLGCATTESVERYRAVLEEYTKQAGRGEAREARNKDVPEYPSHYLLLGPLPPRLEPLREVDKALVQAYRLFSHVIRNSPLPPAIISRINRSTAALLAPETSAPSVIPDNLATETAKEEARKHATYQNFLDSLVEIVIHARNGIAGFAPYFDQAIQHIWSRETVMSLDPTSAGSTPSSIPATQPITASPLAPAGAPTKTSPPKTDPTELRSGMTSPPIDPSQLNNTPAPIPIPSTEHISSDNTPTSPPLRSPEASTSAYMDTGIPLEPASHPTVAETGNLARSPSQSGPGPKSGQLERKQRKQGEGIIKLGSFGGEGLVAKPVPGLKMGDEEAIE